MTRTALKGFWQEPSGDGRGGDQGGRQLHGGATGVTAFVKRVVIANPLQVKAIAHAHVKTDKVDAGTLASLYAADYMAEIWTPDAATERMRRLAARRYQVVRHRTRNEVHTICMRT
ncbi:MULTISPECIES: transposase [unclassified Mesorhizobium]|uniref:IS110 family transposase n=1 Tax=unclassified Mesorhizobium TaxID=325217 RepID=UPI001FE0904E|nr:MULTISPECIES: transposase [unclassified Mesorhizobium]